MGVVAPARRPRPAPVLRGPRRAVRRDRAPPPWRSTTSGGRRASATSRAPAPRTSSWQPHVPQTTAGAIDADITAAIAYLRAARRGADLPVVTVGFCFGGSHSWRQSGGDLDLAGCAGFYGKPSVVGDAARRAHLPTVMLIAGADKATPVADQLALAETMRAAGAEVDAVVYDGAPHSFFDRAFGEWAEACADAWQQSWRPTDRVAAAAEPERGDRVRARGRWGRRASGCAGPASDRRLPALVAASLARRSWPPPRRGRSTIGRVRRRAAASDATPSCLRCDAVRLAAGARGLGGRWTMDRGGARVTWADSTQGSSSAPGEATSRLQPTDWGEQATMAASQPGHRSGEPAPSPAASTRWRDPTPGAARARSADTVSPRDAGPSASRTTRRVRTCCPRGNGGRPAVRSGGGGSSRAPGHPAARSAACRAGCSLLAGLATAPPSRVAGLRADRAGCRAASSSPWSSSSPSRRCSAGCASGRAPALAGDHVLLAARLDRPAGPSWPCSWSPPPSSRRCCPTTPDAPRC